MTQFQVRCNRNVFIAILTVSLIVTAIQPGLAKEPLQDNNPRVPATVEGFESAELYAKVGGYLKSISVDLGDAVSKGDVLAVIDVPEMEKQLAQKQSHLELAKAESNQALARIDESKSRLKALSAQVLEAESRQAEKQALYDFEKLDFERISRLASSGAIQSELLDAAVFKLKAAESALQAVAAHIATAKANLSGGKASVRRSEADAAAADAQIDVAQADLEYTAQLLKYSEIRAPWDGKIASRMYDPGDFVQGAEGNSAAKPILRLIRDSKVKVLFSLSQNHINGLEKGLKVTFKDIAALPDQTFSGSVSRFSTELDPKTRMMRVEMDLDNADGKLKPGFFGYATVHFQ